MEKRLKLLRCPERLIEIYGVDSKPWEMHQWKKMRKHFFEIVSAALETNIIQNFVTYQIERSLALR